MEDPILLLDKAERDLERIDCQNDLLSFAQYVWPVVEPAIPFITGWALEAISEHLMAVTDGEIRRLLINVPPGFTKSLMTDVFWPAWEWGPCDRPWLRYMCAAYSNHLTERDNMRCRNIVLSDRYKLFWGRRFGISNEQFTKVKFANDKTGWKLATSVAGIGTGERADRVIIDDPNNPIEMESEAIRRTTNMWFTEIIPDRLNNQKESAIVVIQQRTHEDDVSGTAISREMGYVHLMIPMRYDNARHCRTIYGWSDPRDDPQESELAWQERFPEVICQELERDKGPYAWAGQYQQTPEPRGGSIIKREYWQLWNNDVYPPLDYVIAALDTAYTEKKENDASALVIFGVFKEDIDGLPEDLSSRFWLPREGMSQVIRPQSSRPKLIMLYAWQERLEFFDLAQRVLQTCLMSTAPSPHPRFPVDRLIIEGKASGLSVAQELYRLVGGSGRLGIEVVDPKRYGDKVARVHSIQHIFADNMVYAPDKKWADEVINQVSVFPRGSHDDLVDCVSMAIRYLRDTGFALRREEAELVNEEEKMYRGQSIPLYSV
jgi:predicted phage terminase large subunit-like protein